MPRRKSRRQRSQTRPDTIGGKTGALFYAQYDQTDQIRRFRILLKAPVSTTTDQNTTRVRPTDDRFADTTGWSLANTSGAHFTISQARIDTAGRMFVSTTSDLTSPTILVIPQLSAGMSVALNRPFAGCVILIEPF